MNVEKNHYNNGIRNFIANRNHIDFHIMLQCYKYLKLSFNVHYYFKITVAICPAARCYYLRLIRKHIFTVTICVCFSYFSFHISIQLFSSVTLCIFFYANKISSQ